jgi:integrase
MVLLALNMAAYLQEVVRLRWDEVRDGCVVTRRNKTGKCIRVAVLWKETLDALAALKRRGEFIFYASTGSPLSISGAEKRFVKLRDAAGLSVTSSQLRDGAYTAAVRANFTESIVKLLVGHRGSGLSDHYVARSPEMVKTACNAVYAAYFGADGGLAA